MGDLDHTSFTIPAVMACLALRREQKEVTLLRYPEQRHWFFGPAADDLNGRIWAFLEEKSGTPPSLAGKATDGVSYW